MSCDVAALPFQAHANWGTWSKDFEMTCKPWIKKITKIVFRLPLNMDANKFVGPHTLCGHWTKVFGSTKLDKKGSTNKYFLPKKVIAKLR